VTFFFPDFRTGLSFAACFKEFCTEVELGVVVLRFLMSEAFSPWYFS
jgi:hypothetical protein